MIAYLDVETVAPSYDGDDFPPLPYHEVVCVSVLYVGSGREEMVTHMGRTEHGEGILLDELGASLESMDQLVTWNGRRFDIPVLALRAAHYECETWRWLRAPAQRAWDARTYRYGGWHCDLMDWWSDYGASSPMGLDDVARALGRPGKSGHGSQVADMVTQGRWDDIRTYCEQDVRTLRAVADASRALGLRLRGES